MCLAEGACEGAACEGAHACCGAEGGDHSGLEKSGRCTGSLPAAGDTGEGDLVEGGDDEADDTEEEGEANGLLCRCWKREGACAAGEWAGRRWWPAFTCGEFPVFAPGEGGVEKALACWCCGGGATTRHCIEPASEGSSFSSGGRI